MNWSAGHAATTERSWGLGIGQEAGMGLCPWLRDKHGQDVVLFGGWDSSLAVPEDAGERSQPSQAAENSPAGRRKQTGNP